MRVIDVTGDGLPDYLQCETTGHCKAWVNTGTGWQQNNTWAPPIAISHFTGVNVDYGVRITDVTGDGLPDFLQCETTGYCKAWIASGETPHLVTKITNGLGVSLEVDYKPLTDSSVYTKGSTATYPEMDIQSPMYVVSQSRTDNGVGSQNTLNYTYAGAKADLSGRGYLGFAKQTVMDAVTGTSVETNFRQDFPFTGLVSSTETHFGSTLLSRETNTHDSTVTGTSTETGSTDPMFIYTSQSVSVSMTWIPVR